VRSYRTISPLLGTRMKDEVRRMKNALFILHPSAFILVP